VYSTIGLGHAWTSRHPRVAFLMMVSNRYGGWGLARWGHESEGWDESGSHDSISPGYSSADPSDTSAELRILANPATSLEGVVNVFTTSP